uniref:Uncharacterized protein n=1 Tax=viral metagenome TaxID=1070528 RepID=A0A6M3LF54_9ZZZZ
MSYTKHSHRLSLSIGGEGQTQGWRSKWLKDDNGRLFRFYRKDPEYVTLSGSADVIKLTIGKAFRLIRIEWSFNDATAKDFKIEVTHPEMAQLGYPTKLLNLDDDINTDGYKLFGEKYEFEDGAELVFTVTGTSTKLFSPTVYVQVI